MNLSHVKRTYGIRLRIKKTQRTAFILLQNVFAGVLGKVNSYILCL